MMRILTVQPVIDDLKHIINNCDYLLIPQTNPKTDYFNKVTEKELMIPRGPGKKACIMANGIYTFDDETELNGGGSGVFLTLNRASQHKNSIDKLLEKEQFIEIANLNCFYDPLRQNQQAQVSIITQLIPIFEEAEIQSEFKELLRKICEIRDSKDENKDEKLKQLLIDNMKQISDCSPFMCNQLNGLEEFKPDEIRNKSMALVV